MPGGVLALVEVAVVLPPYAQACLVAVEDALSGRDVADKYRHSHSEIEVAAVG